VQVLHCTIPKLFAGTVVDQAWWAEGILIELSGDIKVVSGTLNTLFVWQSYFEAAGVVR
jgi:hypothetical protein